MTDFSIENAGFVNRAHEAREAGFPLVCAYCAAGLDRRGAGDHHPGCRLPVESGQIAVSARRGDDAVHLHPDLRPSGIDYATAASDLVADIMHAADLRGLDALEVASRGIRTYQSDLEEAEPVYEVDDLQAAEPALLSVVPGVKVTITTLSDDMGLPRVCVEAGSREELVEYVLANWGDEDEDWFSDHVVGRVREVRR